MCNSNTNHQTTRTKKNKKKYLAKLIFSPCTRRAGKIYAEVETESAAEYADWLIARWNDFDDNAAYVWKTLEDVKDCYGSDLDECDKELVELIKHGPVLEHIVSGVGYYTPYEDEQSIIDELTGPQWPDMDLFENRNIFDD
jgi:hypothetical protein